MMNQFEDDITCSNIYTTKNEFGNGVYAKTIFKKGDLIEKGIARVIPINGNECTYVFTWSDDRTKWALCSGYATFYNTSKTANTIMNRDFVNNTFEIYALKDIGKDEELTHTYRSLEWRECFLELNKTLDHQTSSS